MLGPTKSPITHKAKLEVTLSSFSNKVYDVAGANLTKRCCWIVQPSSGAHALVGPRACPFFVHHVDACNSHFPINCYQQKHHYSPLSHAIDWTTHHIITFAKSSTKCMFPRAKLKTPGVIITVHQLPWMNFFTGVRPENKKANSTPNRRTQLQITPKGEDVITIKLSYWVTCVPTHNNTSAAIALDNLSVNAQHRLE